MVSRAVGAPVRVLQLVHTLNPGGTERLVVELVRRLRDEIPTAVCCLDEDGAWADQLRVEGTQVAALGRRSGFHPTLGRAVATVAKAHEATVIHCHHYSPFVYGCCARVWSPALRVIFTEHGRLSDVPPSLKRRVANAFLARAPREVFTVSESLKTHVVAEGFAEEQVQVIYNGIQVGPATDDRARACARRALAVADDTFVVATIARLDPVKQLDTLLHAIGALGARLPVALAIIGDGRERGRLEEVAARSGVSDRTHFLGHRDDARALLAGCDVYANSSVHEGVSLTILEAMAAGLPVVATAVGGTPEILDGTCGRLVPAKDPTAMADAVHELALNRALRETLGAEARRRVEARFTIERMVSQYRDAYIRVAS